MKKFKVILGTGLVVASLASSLFASNGEEAIWSSPVNLDGEKPVSTYMPASEISLCSDSDIVNTHNSGFDYKGSSDPLERVWGETTHRGISGRAVDGYTRARFEKGSKIQCDSGREWDHDDGRIDGYSEAESGWMLTPHSYTGHTYYGN